MLSQWRTSGHQWRPGKAWSFPSGGFSGRRNVLIFRTRHVLMFHGLQVPAGESAIFLDTETGIGGNGGDGFKWSRCRCTLYVPYARSQRSVGKGCDDDCVISLTKLGDTEIVSCIAFGKRYSDKWASFAEQDTFRKAALNIEKA